jgi:hypothetical protein
MIDQVCGRLHHAPCATAGAKAAALTTECHQVLVAAAVALHPQKAVFQKSTLQVVFELPTYERRQVAIRVLHRLKKAWIMLFNDGI